MLTASIRPRVDDSTTWKELLAVALDRLLQKVLGFYFHTAAEGVWPLSKGRQVFLVTETVAQAACSPCELSVSSELVGGASSYGMGFALQGKCLTLRSLHSVAFCCCVTNGHKPSGSSQHSFTVSRFCVSEAAMAGLGSRSLGCRPFLQTYSCYGQKSVPCCCRT